MNDEEIKQAIAGGEDAVKALVQTISDRRVNEAVETARKKWDALFPDRLEEEIKRREERREQEAANRVAVADALREKFGKAIPEDTWGDLIDVDGIAKLEGDARTAKIDEEAQRVQGIVEKFAKRTYGDKTPPAATSLEDAEQESFKRTLIEKMRF